MSTIKSYSMQQLLVKQTFKLTYSFLIYPHSMSEREKESSGLAASQRMTDLPMRCEWEHSRELNSCFLIASRWLCFTAQHRHAHTSTCVVWCSITVLHWVSISETCALLTESKRDSSAWSLVTAFKVAPAAVISYRQHTHCPKKAPQESLKCIKITLRGHSLHR